MSYKPGIGPRERLFSAGADALTNTELLAIFLRTGVPGKTALECADNLLTQLGGVREVVNASNAELSQFPGAGKVFYAQLQAMKALAKRYYHERVMGCDVMSNVAQTRTFLISALREALNERFAVLFLNSQHQLICFETLFFGTINAANVYPRVVVQKVLHYNAAAVILAHNHPSGVAEPSQADQLITQRLVVALELIDVAVLDHFVIGGGHAVSLAERGML